MLLLGLALAGGGLGAGLLALLASVADMLPMRQGNQGEIVMTMYIAAEMLLVLGVPLCVSGVAPLFRIPRRHFGLGPWWTWLLAWLGVLAAGQFVMLQPDRPIIVEATLHLAAMLLPVLTLAAWLAPLLAARGISWRGAWLHFTSGATLSVVSAILLEVVGVVLLAIAVFALAALLTPDAPARLQELINAWNTGQLLQDPDALQKYLSWAPLVIFAVLTFSVAVPLIEETVKPGSVLLQLVAHRGELDPGAAFLVGALCGAGFALVEGPLNTITSVGNDAWAATVLLRAGATLLHACNTAVAAWAWAELLERRRWGRWLLGMTVALVMHALWNGSTIVLLFTGQVNEDVVTGVGVVFYVFMSLVSGAGVIAGARMLRAARPPALEVAGPPPA